MVLITDTRRSLEIISAVSGTFLALVLSKQMKDEKFRNNHQEVYMIVKTRIAGLMTALMVLSIPVVWADAGVAGDLPKQDGDWHHAQHAQMTAKILNLSDDQVKQLADIHQKKKEAMKSDFEQMRTNKEALEAEIVKTSADMTKINAIQTQIKTLQSQMIDDHLNFILEIKKIMTPEQFAGYMALEREEDMMKFEGHHHFDHRDGFGKEGNGHEHWGDKADKDHNPDGND